MSQMAQINASDLLHCLIDSGSPVCVATDGDIFLHYLLTIFLFLHNIVIC